MDNSLGSLSSGMTRGQLCQFASRLCAAIEAEAGTAGFRGGIYTDNIDIDADGSVSIGPAGEGVLSGEELLFAAPELYWNGKRLPCSDVYSVGLVLYQMSEGKLPFEGPACTPRRAQQQRMQGTAFNPPASAGRRLGDIIFKALSFNGSDRYRNVGEMKIMLDNCLKNLFLNDAPCSQVVFSKDDDSLSEIERMMVSIIENHDDLEEDSSAERIDEESMMTAVPEDGDEAAPEEEAAAEAEAEAPSADEAEPEAAAAPEEEPAAGYAMRDPAMFTGFTPPVNDDPVPESEEEIIPEDIYFPEASQEAEVCEEPEEEPAFIPAEPDDGLAPVMPVRKAAEDFPDIRVTTDGTVRKAAPSPAAAAAARRRRRRPLIFILLLCGILLIAAFIFNRLTDVPELYAETDASPEIISVNTPTIEIVTPPPTQEIPELTPPPAVFTEPHYEFFKANVSWTEAQELCLEKGGRLAVIHSAEDFNTIATLAEREGVDYVWIGLHRTGGELVWESDESVDECYTRWAPGEPSVYDGDVPEDYVLLWNNNGWSYNDCINDPAPNYGWYWDNIGYVCETQVERQK